MKAVGEKLRRERVERGIDLAGLAERTRISRRYLEAIESGTSADLPSGFFYRSFVRQYAQALDLDLPEIDAELERVRLAEEPVLTGALEQAKFPVKSPDPIVTEGNRQYLRSGRMWAYVALLAAVLVGCSAFYAWWRRWEANPAAKPGESVQTAQNIAPTAAVQTPAPQLPKPSEPAPTAQTPDALPASKAPAISPDDRIVVTLSATQPSWVSVYSDGKSIFSGMLQPNQTVTLGGRERTQVKLGNAGGVDISWNGKTIGPIGRKNQVRTVQLTPESYHVTEPVGSL